MNKSEYKEYNARRKGWVRNYLLNEAGIIATVLLLATTTDIGYTLVFGVVLIIGNLTGFLIRSNQLHRSLTDDD